jgi:general stress protein YciG
MNSKRGFASMTPEKRRLIASLGGKAAQAKGTGHRWTPEKAREAGSKGGKATQAKDMANRWDAEGARMAAARRKRRR